MGKRIYRDKCRHFNGIQHGTCRAGVEYASVRDISGQGMARFPCLDTGKPCATECPKRELLTQEEHAAEEAEVASAIKTYLAKVEAGECPVCGKPIEPSRVIGRCLYAACGHRLGQVDTGEEE